MPKLPFSLFAPDMKEQGAFGYRAPTKGHQGSNIEVPALVIHGDADRIVPIEASGRRTAHMIKGARLVAMKDGPHAVNWTHAEEVNSALLAFLP